MNIQAKRVFVSEEEDEEWGVPAGSSPSTGASSFHPLLVPSEDKSDEFDCGDYDFE